eukprot:9669046-Alexandrium_andersonii.AAC.1
MVPACPGAQCKRNRWAFARSSRPGQSRVPRQSRVPTTGAGRGPGEQRSKRCAWPAPRGHQLRHSAE